MKANSFRNVWSRNGIYNAPCVIEFRRSLLEHLVDIELHELTNLVLEGEIAEVWQINIVRVIIEPTCVCHVL